MKYFQILNIIFCLVFLSSAQSDASTVQKFKPIEIPVKHSQQGIKNVWDDVSVTCTLKTPDGTTINTKGFYHSKDLWMVRFAPDQVGMWNYQISVSDKSGQTQILDSFLCVQSGEQGFIRLHPNNPKRWFYSGTGNLYTAVGFGDCMGAVRESIFGDADLMDGGFRPKGFHEGIEWVLPYSQYLTAYGDAAGFNLYRFSDGNCAYSNIKTISASGNDFDTLHCRWTDTLFYGLRSHGFRIFMTILATPQGNSSDNNSMAATFRFAQYCIDRYGSLVDFWELTNESSPDSLWISKVAQYFHANDPYHHLVSMSWEKPIHPAVDIISPHWYGKEDVRNSDQSAADQINQFQLIPKPVIFGEQGQGLWDSLAQTRMRARIWSALFNEGILVFWNSSFAKDCDCNQYIGWEERRITKVLQNFSEFLDSGVRKLPTQNVGHLKVWGLSSSKTLALYIHDNLDIKEINSGKQITVQSNIYGTGYWYDVHTGDIIETAEVGLGQQILSIPDFQTDIAFIARFSPIPPPTDSLFRVDVNPRTVMLLNTPIKTKYTFSLTIRNIGKKPVTIDKAWTSSPSPIFSMLSLHSFPYVLLPSEGIEVPIEYEMSDTGGTGAMLSIQHDASPAWENVAISATGVPRSSVIQNESTSAAVKLFPDPASDRFSIEVFQSISGEARANMIVQLSTLDGAKIAEKRITEGELASFDTSKLPSGTYQIEVLVKDRILDLKRVTILH